MKKTLTLTIVIALLLSVVGGEFVGTGYANPALRPEDPPAGYTINADGTYSGQNIQRDGNLYFLTGNINCTIVIERSGVVLDGAGYTVRGNGDSSGVWLQDKSDVTIKNLNIRNFRFGIKFSPRSSTPNSTANCKIIANNIINNTYGMSVPASSNCYIAENYITENIYGLYTESSSNTFKNNRFELNARNIFYQPHDSSEIDPTNTVDGKSIICWVNQHDRTVPSNAGAVILKDCQGIKIENLNLKNNRCGLLLINTNDCTITTNTFSECFNGIYLTGCFGNTITDNQITNNEDAGIQQFSSGNNQIVDNVITRNGLGIASSNTKDDVISNNQVIANGKGISAGTQCKVTNNKVTENSGDGIFLRDINGSTITGNIIKQNKGCGIGFGDGPNGVVKGNNISNNDVGIWISNAYGNTIISNNVEENVRFSIRLEGSHHDNLIYHNNFIDNNKGGVQASIAQVWVYPDLFKHEPPQIIRPGQTPTPTPRPPQQVGGAANAWDDGTEGNYWSDRQSADNSAYYINENNQDNHPLQTPHAISSFETPTKIIRFPSSSTQPSKEQTQEPIKTPSIFRVAETVAIVITLVISVAAAIVLGAVLYFKRGRDEKQRKEL